jgi:hypothetical protein
MAGSATEELTVNRIDNPNAPAIRAALASVRAAADNGYAAGPTNGTGGIADPNSVNASMDYGNPCIKRSILRRIARRL